MKTSKYLVKPGSEVDLHKIDADEYHSYSGSKETALAEIKLLNLELDKLQKVQHAEKNTKF